MEPKISFQETKSEDIWVILHVLYTSVNLILMTKSYLFHKTEFISRKI